MTRFDFGMVLRSVFLSGLAASSAGLHAQAAPPTTVQQLVLTPSYQANVARLFAQLPPDVFQRCPTLVSRGSSVTIVEPATFASDGYPTAGLWRQSFPISGCGNDTTINLFFKAGPDERIISVVAVPGATHADLALQRDAIQFARIAVQAKAPNCPKPHVRTTRYIGAVPGAPAGTNILKQPWQESWTISACGAAYDVPITFVPDATGTTIHTAPAQSSKP